MDHQDRDDQHLTGEADGGPAFDDTTDAIAEPVAPVGETERIHAIDVLRGFALLGIMPMNITGTAVPFGAYMNPNVHIDFEGINRAIYMVVHVIFDMKMMTLFSMLFGAGVLFFDRKAASRDDVPRIRSLWLRRMGWLFLIGMLHAYLLWYGDILVPYAVCGLVLVWWVRRLSPAWLITIGAVMVLISIGSGISQGIGLRIAETDPAVAKGMAQTLEMMQPTEEQLAADITRHRDGSYLSILAFRAPMMVGMQLFFIPIFMFWRAGGVMLIGLALAKLGIITGARSVRFYAIQAIVGYAIGLPLVIAGLRYNIAHDFDPASFWLIGMQLNAVGSIAVAMGHLGLLYVLLKLGALKAIAGALAAVGRTALTNYLLQSLVMTTVYYGYGLALYGDHDRAEQLIVVAATWALSLIASPIWLRFYRFGPAEWLWRSLTYWKPQPMRRTA